MFLSFLMPRRLFEGRNSPVGIVVGKFSPVTKGHQKMIDRLIAECTARKCTPVICVVDVERLETGKLLTGPERKKQLVSIYGNMIEILIVKNAFAAMLAIQESGRECELIVCGSDRTAQYKVMSSKIFGDHQKTMPDVVALSRDPDSDAVSGLSSSKARAAVAADDLPTFKSIVAGPSTQALFVLLKKRLGEI
jgi:phosphopantetheine adenylyltransferase